MNTTAPTTISAGTGEGTFQDATPGDSGRSSARIAKGVPEKNGYGDVKAAGAAGRSAGRSVRAGEHHHIAVGVAQPALPVVRATVPGRWIAMTGQDDLGL